MQNKKQLIAEYKNRKQIGGICKITNIQTKRVLVYIATDIEAAKNLFDFSKKTGSCINPKLENDWTKYGSDLFTFEIIEKLEKNIEQTSKEFTEDLNELLKMYIQSLSNENMY
jgi:hypothetical protein